MPSLKGLACVSFLTFAISAPSAFAQSTDTPPPASRAPATAPANPSATPGDQQTAPKTGKHQRRNRNSSARGQPSAAPPTGADK